MDANLEFRFVTRTLSEDYRVYSDGGTRLLSDRSEFEPLRQKGGIVPEEGPCVVLFEDGGRAFLVASGMRRPSRDVAGRPIRFSFCQIFGSGRRERERAWAAFERLTTGWSEAELKMGTLIREVPRAGQGTGALLGEDVRFDQEAFMLWLQQGRKSAAFQVCRDGEAFPVKRGERYLYPLWPAAGCLLRWAYQDGKTRCQRMEAAPAGESAPLPELPKRRKRRWIIAAALLLLCAVFGARLWWKAEREAEQRAEEQKLVEERDAAQRAKDAVKKQTPPRIHALAAEIFLRLEATRRHAEGLLAELSSASDDTGRTLSSIVSILKATREAEVLLQDLEAFPRYSSATGGEGE